MRWGLGRVQTYGSVRDSKDQAGPMLTFTSSGWQAFLADARSREFSHSTRG
ncbi:DUF397 domain-containing protein [Streptomyces sp. SID12488]|uniref:DUF397 domain-containing protein n=1 Tax=Streptomyces sp. SID12488 TaxID=2706040 RepID=UPI0019410081